MARVLDFTKVKGFEPLPDGEYLATLTEAEYVEKTPTSKGDYVKLTFTVAEGEHEGQKLFRNLSLTEKSLPYYKETMMALGADPEAFDDDELDVEELAKDQVGNTALLVVEIQENEGRRSNNVKRVRDASFR